MRIRDLSHSFSSGSGRVFSGGRYSFSSLLFLLLPYISAIPVKAEDTQQGIFSPTFRTLTVKGGGDLMSPPIIRLGSDDFIDISFDEISDDFRYLRYRLVHCNADWQPSRLLESEYLPRFNEGEIEDYAFSSNTFVHFVNYHLTVPGEGMEPMVSGNYLLQVYDADAPDEILLQVRFGVSENTVAVNGDVTGRTDKGFNTIWQQLGLRLTPTGLRMQNPYQDITVAVTQNQRPSSRRLLRTPQRVQGEDIIFEHEPNLIFPAGNEYRRFETVRITEQGMHVDSIRFGGSNYHVWLQPDEWRAGREYHYDRTQRGRYLVRESNSSDSDLGADYLTVHFTLDAPEVADGDIYVEGMLSDNSLTDRWRMKYDRDSGLYTLQAPLKQGSYNYQYVVAPRNGDGKATSSPIEGDYYETVNEYLVEVYYHPPGARADRMLGHALLVWNP